MRDWQNNPNAPAFVDSIPLGRWGSPNDVAAAVDFLISNRASFITGTDLRIDSGSVHVMGNPLDEDIIQK